MRRCYADSDGCRFLAPVALFSYGKKPARASAASRFRWARYHGISRRPVVVSGVNAGLINAAYQLNSPQLNPHPTEGFFRQEDARMPVTVQSRSPVGYASAYLIIGIRDATRRYAKA